METLQIIAYILAVGGAIGILFAFERKAPNPHCPTCEGTGFIPVREPFDITNGGDDICYCWHKQHAIDAKKNKNRAIRDPKDTEHTFAAKLIKLFPYRPSTRHVSKRWMNRVWIQIKVAYVTKAFIDFYATCGQGPMEINK